MKSKDMKSKGIKKILIADNEDCNVIFSDLLPDPHLHAQALAVMNAGWERGGHVYSADQMRAYASSAVTSERERTSALLATIREHWVKANGADSLSVDALDQIAEVIADGSYVRRV